MTTRDPCSYVEWGGGDFSCYQDSLSSCLCVLTIPHSVCLSGLQEAYSVTCGSSSLRSKQQKSNDSAFGGNYQTVFLQGSLCIVGFFREVLLFMGVVLFAFFLSGCCENTMGWSCPQLWHLIPNSLVEILPSVPCVLGSLV